MGPVRFSSFNFNLVCHVAGLIESHQSSCLIIRLWQCYTTHVTITDCMKLRRYVSFLNCVHFVDGRTWELIT